MSQKKAPVAHIYNPANQSEQELIANFVVRQKEFHTLLNDIKTAPMQYPEQDYIIQGPRGSGKTTLLLRLFYAIKHEEDLNTRLIPVIFNEEQYFIRTLDRLWEAVIEEINKNDLGKVCEPSQHYLDEEEHYFQHLTTLLQQQQKKIILLIDNIGDMLDKFSDLEQHRLRERLQTSADIRIIGASSKILEHTYDYSKPFFEFFKFIYLKGLTAEETDQLLLRLSQSYNEPRVNDIIKHQRGRVETLRRLTGGIPRTIILLFEIFADDQDGDSFRDLEAVLDRVTPLYKHRMDDLFPEQQELVDVIALNWDAITFEEIAAKVRMEERTVKEHLENLLKNRIIQLTPTPAKTQLYQITERFFNIWYLMRCGRGKHRNRVLWLVKFLQDWCNQEELVGRAKKLMTTIDTGNYHPLHAFYITEALAKTGLPEDIQHDLIEKTRAFLAKKDNSLLQELSKSDRELFQEAIIHYYNRKFESSLSLFEAIQNKNATVHHFMASLYHKYKNYRETEKYYLKAIEGGQVEAIFHLAWFYQTIHRDYAEAEKYYLKSVEYGQIEAMFNLACLYQWVYEDYIKAETYYLQAIEHGHVEATYNLAWLYETVFQDDARAESYYLQAIELMIKTNNFDQYGGAIVYVLLFLLTREYYKDINRLLQDKHFQLENRYKPLYYALMYFMQDKYPDEYFKMGEELQETVEEIINRIEQWRKKYAEEPYESAINRDVPEVAHAV